jgi:NitT/TauT family transport system permease protein/sulfonate transport system permease protein
MSQTAAEDPGLDLVDATGAGPRPVGATFKTLRPAKHETTRGRRRRRMLERALRYSMPFVVLLIWQITSDREVIDPSYFPSPTTIWSSAVELVENGRLWEATVDTGWRVLQGFFWGSLIGFVIGVALGTSRLMRAAFEPVIYAFWTIPKLAVLPLLLLIFGFGDTPMIMLIILNTSFLVLIPTVSAMSGVPEAYRETGRAFEVGRWQMFRHILLPSTLPEVFVALKLAAGASILVAVAAEFVNGNTGLGFLIWNSWQVFLPEPMYVGIVVVAVLGTMFTLLIGMIGRRVAPWAEGL